MNTIIIKVQSRRKLSSHPGSASHTQSEYIGMCKVIEDKKEYVPFIMGVSEIKEEQFAIETDCTKSDDEVIEYFKQGMQNAGIDIVSISKVTQ